MDFEMTEYERSQIVPAPTSGVCSDCGKPYAQADPVTPNGLPPQLINPGEEYDHAACYERRLAQVYRVMKRNHQQAFDGVFGPEEQARARRREKIMTPSTEA